jgi:signal transduction histidine kinase
MQFLGNVALGSHLCEFYSTREELADTLVPYFAAGLQHDEFCLWVTSDPSGAKGAQTRLIEMAPYFERYFHMEQIEIWDYHEWYLRGGRFDADRAFGQLAGLEERALRLGYRRFRISGDIAWLDERDWGDFMAYEAEVNRVLPQHRMIALCTYPLERCTAHGVLEVVHNHQGALGRVAGEWKMIESSGLKIENQELQPLNERPGIETSVSELQRLSEHLLSRQDQERRWIATQLHEVTAQNVSALSVYIASLQQRKSAERHSILEKCRTLCEQSIEQILDLSHELHPPIQDQFGLAMGLQWYITDLMKRSRIHIAFEEGPDIGRLPLETETHLFRVAQEGLSNILRRPESLDAIVRLRRQADQVILEIEDFGRGMPATATAAALDGAGEIGFGILRMQVRLGKIGGRLEIRSSDQGTILTASVRLNPSEQKS